MQEIDFYLVDAFSASSFGGNPAAVCPLDAWLPDETLLRMAQQHNQSETAFFVCTKGGIELRWFTTLTEVNLCGHATLAVAYILFNELDYPDSRLHFDTASGRLTVSREGDWMTLDFPACPTQAQTPPPELLTALGISHYVEARKGRAWVLVLESREQVEAINPDFSAMTPGEHKVAVTARDEGEYDFISRFFSPGVAVPEDPVTGSAHTMLIPYWSARLGKNTDVCPPGFRPWRRRTLRTQGRPRADGRAGGAVSEGHSISALNKSKRNQRCRKLIFIW